MKPYNYLFLFMLSVALFLLSGCADSHTTGTEKDTDIRVAITVNQYANNKGNTTISPGVDFASATGDTKQDTANTAETPTKVDLNLDDVNNPVTTTLTKTLERKADAKIRKKVEEVEASSPSVSPTGEMQQETAILEKFPDNGNGGKVFSWLKMKGEEYGGPIKIEVEGSGIYSIPDSTKKWGLDGNYNNHNQFIYFPGNWPGQDTHPLGFASVVAGPDCTTAGTKVTITYNKATFSY